MASDSAAMMIRTFTHETGFAPPRVRTLGNERATVLVAELIATVALALSTLTVVAAVAHAC
jgi:hypothetical protein